MTPILALIFIIVVMLFLLSALASDDRDNRRPAPDDLSSGYPTYQYEDPVGSRVD